MHNLIISALLGLVAGAIGGYLAGYSKGKKDGHKAAEAELGSAKAYLENHATNTPVAVPHEPPVPTQNGAVSVNQYTNDALHVERQPERVKYYACYGNTPPEVFTAPTDEALEDENIGAAWADKAYTNEIMSEGGDSSIWLIEPGQFGELGTRSPQMVLKWWVGSDILTTGEDEIIDNKQRFVGPFLETFHRNNQPENPIYVRNSIVGIDAMIEKIPAIFDGEIVYYEGM